MNVMEFLKSLSGKATMTLLVDGSTIAKVNLKDKDITVEVKDPVKAMEMGFHKLLNSRKEDEKKSVRKALKLLGFRIKLKYSIFEMEV